MLKSRRETTDNRRVTLLLAFVVGWCSVSALVAFGLGPLLHRAAVLAERHETPHRGTQRTAA